MDWESHCSSFGSSGQTTASPLGEPHCVYVHIFLPWKGLQQLAKLGYMGKFDTREPGFLS